MLRWAASWQLTALLSLLAATIAVLALTGVYVPGGDEPQLYALILLAFSIYQGTYAWVRYKHPRKPSEPEPEK